MLPTYYSPSNYEGLIMIFFPSALYCSFISAFEKSFGVDFHVSRDSCDTGSDVPIVIMCE